jgi:CRISPR/Cas system Type II protein with McrA/HNH and RuvC-like nuclease domain
VAGVSKSGISMDIYDEFMSTGHWGPIETQLGIEFQFRCAYCDKDMFDSVDNYKEWQTDHIIPSSKDGCDTIENFALCCRTCNFIKGKWNPFDFLGELDATKENLIKVAKVYITEKRQQTQQDINLYKAIIARHG